MRKFQKMAVQIHLKKFLQQSNFPLPLLPGEVAVCDLLGFFRLRELTQKVAGIREVKIYMLKKYTQAYYEISSKEHNSAEI